MEKAKLNVAISNFHGGQIVEPVVTAAQALGHTKHGCTVTLKWFDRSDRTYSAPQTFTGTRDEAERWLLANGVHLDAQGIY